MRELYRFLSQQPKSDGAASFASRLAFFWFGELGFLYLHHMRAHPVKMCFVLLLLVGCSTTNTILVEPEPKAQVSFQGTTQVGEETHYLQVRRLAYFDVKEKQQEISCYAYVVYVAGSYGPEILEKIDGAGFLVKKASNDTVDIYYTAGAHTDIRETWKLLGYTAVLQEQKEIEWNQKPKN